MDMYEALKVSREGDVGVIRLSVPAKRNAMTPVLTREYPAAVRELRDDPSIRAVVLAADGPVFCAGGDLATLLEQLTWNAEVNRRYMAQFYRAYLSAIEFDVPTVVAIGGDAIGAGLAFTLVYDIRIAADSARLGVTFLNLGLHPGMGTTHLVPLAVGDGKAAELVLTGQLINGVEAARIGLVNEAVPAADVFARAMEIAGDLARKPTSAMRMAKRALVKRKIEGLEAALDYEATAQMSSFASEEMRAALDSMLSKSKSKTSV
jgi:enoyl-CoA hydratase/carnithine racemase